MRQAAIDPAVMQQAAIDAAVMRRAWLVLVLLAWRSMHHRLPVIDPSLFRFKSFRLGSAFGVALAVTIIGSTLAVGQIGNLGADQTVRCWGRGTLAVGQIGNLGTSYIMLAAGGAVTAVLGWRCARPRDMSAHAFQ